MQNIEQKQELGNYIRQREHIETIMLPRIDAILSLIEKDMKIQITDCLKDNIKETIILSTEECCKQAVTEYESTINQYNYVLESKKDKI